MSNKEQAELVRLLKMLEPGFYPYPIFEQLARLVVLSIIEFVPLRTKNDRVEILLLERGDDDPLFLGELHTPGTVIRPGDNANNTYRAFSRIIDDELHGSKFSAPHFVGSILHESKRGPEHAQVYWIESVGESNIGEWYPVEELPKNLMKSQLAFIKVSVASYKKAKSLDS